MKVEQSWQGLKITPEGQLQTVGRPWLADSFELLLAGILSSEKYETEQKNEGDTAGVATIVPELIGPWNLPLPQEILPKEETVISDGDGFFERLQLQNEVAGSAEDAGKERVFRGLNQVKDEALKLVGLEEELSRELGAKGFTVKEEGNMVPGKEVAVTLADAGEGSFHQGRDGTIFIGKELPAELKAVPDSKGMQPEISPEGIRNGSKVFERVELLENDVAVVAENTGRVRVFQGINRAKDEAINLVGVDEGLRQELRVEGFTVTEEGITVPGKEVAVALADAGEGSFHHGRDGTIFTEKELPAELKVVPGSRGMRQEISPEGIRNESRVFERVELKKNEVTVVAENGGKKNIPQAEQGEVKAELKLSSKGLLLEPSQAIREKEAVKTFSKAATNHEVKPKPAVEIPTFDLSPKVAKNALDNLLPAENLKFNFPSFLAKVENLVQKAQKAGTNLTASFKLYPEELGEVRVTVKLTGKNVEISLKVFSNEAAWYLQNAGKELAVTLQKHHLELSGFNVGLEQNSNFFNQSTFSFTKNNARLQKVKNYQNGPVAEPVLEKNPLAEKVTGLNCLV